MEGLLLCYNVVMDNLNDSVVKLRKKYRNIFTKIAHDINDKVLELKPDIEGEIFDKYEKDSLGYIWQKDVIKLFDDKISKEVYMKWQKILEYRENFKCVGCATCCKLACSEFSPKDLKDKADNGDNFASQFLSVFVPYDSKEEAREIYPEYIKMLEYNKEEDVYFYHCPKLTTDNRCSDYENRPKICRDFPDNPLVMLPNSCGYKKWKEEVEDATLVLHSVMEIIDYYKNNISK